MEDIKLIFKQTHSISLERNNSPVFSDSFLSTITNPYRKEKIIKNLLLMEETGANEEGLIQARTSHKLKNYFFSCSYSKDMLLL